MEIDSSHPIFQTIETGNGKPTSSNIIVLPSQQEAQAQAWAEASGAGARVFQCHIYEQGRRTHLAFSVSMNLLLEIARLQNANRPLIPNHVDEIARYLVETKDYILPPFVFNSSTPIKVFAFGMSAVKFGYAVIPSELILYVTDGQHRLKAIEKALPERPELRNDGATVLVVQEDDIDKIHQDFADCAKNKPIPPALLAAFDISNPLAELTRQLSRELVIFNGRIDKTSKSVGKATNYLFTMNQLQIGVAEFLFGSSRKQVLKSCSIQVNNEFNLQLEKVKTFYRGFAEINESWKQLLKPASETGNLDLYSWRQERIDFTTIGLQIISRVGHHIFFSKGFTEQQRFTLLEALASLDYKRDSALWENSLVVDDGNGNKKIVAKIATANKGFEVAMQEVEKQTSISLTV